MGKIEITEDMNYDQKYYTKVYNDRVDALEKMMCFSPYTPSMKLGDDVDRIDDTTVMLEIPTRVVKSAILISEEINAKSEEMYGEEWGITPFCVLASAYEKSNILHDPDDVVRDEMDEINRFHKPRNK